MSYTGILAFYNLTTYEFLLLCCLIIVSLGYVVPSHEDVLSFLLDICSSKAIMTSVGSKEGKTSKSSLLTFKDLAMLNNTLSITLSQTALDPSSNSLASPASLVNGKKEAFRNCSVIVRLIWFSILKRFSECYRKVSIRIFLYLP